MGAPRSLPPPVPDLLRERRLELGLPVAPKPLRPAQTLLKLGVGSGLVLVGLSLATLPWFSYREGVLQADVDQLAPVEQRVGAAQARIKSLNARTKALDQATQQIASQLVAVRSGSAFLEQLRRITPEGVRLLSVTVQASELRISGEAEAAGAFEKINALDLNLETLAAVPTQGAQVLKATREADGLVTFSIKVLIDPSVKPTPEQLRDLGADGLARRYALLQDEGIPL